MVLIHQKMASIAGNLPPWTDSKRFAWRQQHVFLFFSPGWSCHPLKENGSCKKKKWNRLKSATTDADRHLSVRSAEIDSTPSDLCHLPQQTQIRLTGDKTLCCFTWRVKKIWRKINNFSQKLTLMFSLSFLPRFSTSAWMSGAGSSVWGRRDHQNMTGKFFHFYRCSQL